MTDREGMALKPAQQAYEEEAALMLEEAGGADRLPHRSAVTVE